jgi:hypothetical protein
MMTSVAANMGREFYTMVDAFCRQIKELNR